MTIKRYSVYGKEWLVVGLIAIPLFLLGYSFTHKPLFPGDYSTVILARGGELLGASIAGNGQWAFPPDGSLSPKFIKAIVCFEDKRFFQHSGVDYWAIGRALASNLSRKKITSGASTITMQLFRLSRGKQKRTLTEKIIETALAQVYELFRSKSDIMRLFCAHAPFGGNVVGLEAASWRYFGRNPDNLTWAEAAMLAVLPNNPGLIHPGRNRDILLDKRNRLLAKLYKQKIIDGDTLDMSITEPLPPVPFPLPQDAPHLLFRIAASGNGKTSARVRTTIDDSLQLRVNDIVKKHNERLSGSGIKNIAAIVCDADSGEILAYVGNAYNDENTNKNKYVDILTSPRSTGSLLKPFLFAACLDSGELLPTQLIPDVPTRLGSYIPQNNSKGYLGAVSAHDALVQSLNIPFVLTLKSYGLDRFYALLKQLGMTTLVRSAQGYGLPLIIGGAEGTLEELTGMFAGLVRRAKQKRADENQNVFFNPSVFPDHNKKRDNSKSNPISVGAAWLTLETLLDLARPGEEGAWQEFLSSKKIAWKTGTSYGYRDAWAIGVTPKYAVGIWIGNATGEGRPELRGAFAAAPILFEIFSGLNGQGWIPAPLDRLKLVSVCTKSGYIAGPVCSEKCDTYVPVGAEIAGICPYCRIVHLDRTGSFQVTSECEDVGRMRNQSWFVLNPAMEWYYKKSHSNYKPLPPFKRGCEEDKPQKAINILYPESHARIYIPIDLDGKPGKTVCQAVHRDPDAVIYWHIDGEYFGQTETFHQIEFRVGPGKHVITVVDDKGNTLDREFDILSEK